MAEAVTLLHVQMLALAGQATETERETLARLLDSSR